MSRYLRVPPDRPLTTSGTRTTSWNVMKLTVPQLVQKFPLSYAARRFSTVSTRASHFYCYHLRIYLQIGLFSWVLPSSNTTKITRHFGNWLGVHVQIEGWEDTCWVVLLEDMSSTLTQSLMISVRPIYCHSWHLLWNWEKPRKKNYKSLFRDGVRVLVISRKTSQ